MGLLLCDAPFLDFAERRVSFWRNPMCTPGNLDKALYFTVIYQPWDELVGRAPVAYY